MIPTPRAFPRYGAPEGIYSWWFSTLLWNIRLGVKGLHMTNTSLIVWIVTDEEKTFYGIDACWDENNDLIAIHLEKK
jgi:hypothetical protein